MLLVDTQHATAAAEANLIKAADSEKKSTLRERLTSPEGPSTNGGKFANTPEDLNNLDEQEILKKHDEHIQAMLNFTNKKRNVHTTLKALVKKTAKVFNTYRIARKVTETNYLHNDR